jgi:hypothetical protein
LIFVVSLSFSISQKNQIAKHNHAIIFAPVVSAKSSPDDSGKDLFILHAGTKVETGRIVGDWCEVKIADGNKGGYKKNHFKKYKFKVSFQSRPFLLNKIWFILLL